MQINAYLTFNGNCEEAFAFYQKSLEGKILSMFTYGSTPMAESTPSDWLAKIVHARMEVGGNLLMGSDATPDRYAPPKGMQLNIGVTDTSEAERLFHILAEGGQILMPIAKTFWAERFGMLVDRFGIPWMVNCEAPS